MIVDYDDLHKKWDTIHLEYASPTFRLRSKLILDLIGKLYPKNPESNNNTIHILDIGCGTGDYAISLAKKRFLVTGVDFSEYAIKIAREKCVTLDKNIPQFKYSDITTFATDEQFDLILMSEVLEHIADDKQIIEKYREFCKPDGHLIISVPFDPDLWSFEDEQAGHIRRYSNDMINALFHQSGFRIVKRSWVGFPTIKLMWILKITAFRRFMQLSNTSREKNKSVLMKLISRLMVTIDSHFSWVKTGVGIIVLAKKV